MSQNGKRDDDFAAYLWKSTDYGKTWREITNNIPCGPVNVIREDPKNKDILYVGTDLGVYVSVNGGAQWHVLANNIPTTFVHDLVIHPRDSILAAATHGRGMFAMDVNHLQQLTKEILAKKMHLFEILPAKLPQRRWWGWAGGQSAYIHYYLKETQKVELSIKDQSGKTIKEIKGTGDAGLNAAVWDLTFTKSKETQKEKPETPYVKPGKYTVVLTAGPISLEGTIEVKAPNPRRQ